MRRQVLFLDMGAVNVRVDLCGGNVGMPENLLDDAQIGSAGKHVRRERVAQRVRVKVLDAYSHTRLCDDLVNRLPREARSTIVQEHRRTRPARFREGRSCVVKVVCKRA